MKTELNDRVLWFDGTSQVNPELVPDLLLLGIDPSMIVVNSQNEDIQKFNQLADKPIEFGKTENSAFDKTWNVPDRYMNMDLDHEIHEMLIDFLVINSRLSKEQKETYKKRMEDELKEIHSRGMEPLVKTLMYVLDRLRESNTVWGVGRGSSCASLVLFLIGLHKVDPVKYNIPLEEFFHD